MEQEIRTGDPATDKECMDEMRRSYEAAGMTVEVTPLPGGGFRIKAEMAQVAAFTTPQGQTVRVELDQAFDSWVDAGYQARAVSPPLLHLAAFWYHVAGDPARLKRAVTAINMVPVSHPWHYLGEPTMMWTQALQRAMQRAAVSAAASRPAPAGPPVRPDRPAGP